MIQEKLDVAGIQNREGRGMGNFGIGVGRIIKKKKEERWNWG